MECPICLENLDAHVCETECGHKFHSRCMFETIFRGNNKCPCCRYVLVQRNKQAHFPMQIVERTTTDESEIILLRPIIPIRNTPILEQSDIYENTTNLVNTDSDETILINILQIVNERRQENPLIRFIRNITQ